MISNGSIKRCRKKFGDIVGIGKLINNAVDLLNEEDHKIVIAEFIYDYDNKDFYNVLLFLLKDNYNFKELEKFDFV